MQSATRATRGGRKTRANITVATLNINGRGQANDSGLSQKWQTIHSLIKLCRLGVLATQESHLDDSDVTNIHCLFGRRILIVNSPDAISHNARGVSFVINRELVDTTVLQTYDLIPGRALMLSLHWHGDQRLSLLNIYAPNSAPENAAFWPTLQTALSQGGIPRPDVILGDFNVVLDGIDRFPMHADHPAAVDALTSLLTLFGLEDGWRMSEPTAATFTFPTRDSSHKSRLDRIYARHDLLLPSSDWLIRDTNVRTDHRLASVRLSTASSPFIGKGRWTLPLHLLDDELFMEQVLRLGTDVLSSIKLTQADAESRTATENPQIQYYRFKVAIQDIARRRLKAKVPRLRISIERLITQVDQLSRRTDARSSVTVQDEISYTQDRLTSLLRAHNNDLREVSMARYISNGERISKYWSKLNRDHKPRDIFYSLRIPDSTPDAYERRSDLMSQLARNYHNNLQHSDDETISPEEHSQHISDTLSVCDKTLNPWDTDILRGSITKEDIDRVLHEAPTGKASGLDGLPYEFWKRVRDLYKLRKDTDKPHFDYSLMLALVCDDIETYGVLPGGHFNDGWMCPLYKKGDRREIHNYRPITLLNCDYKVYSKAIAVRLALVIPTVIHPSQAAFISGRHIEDQTQLCRIMIDYCETVEENGLLVALDQEKAYDRIRHDYLWKTLAHFNIPESMITRIKRLYEEAHTTVIINGECSDPFLVTRGVRQGDPLSCILFIMAIEPLSCQLRSSNMIGFHIPGTAERLINTLFADDTSAFLSQYDSWSDLWSILSSWCVSSGARFNDPKTEIIPMGSAKYRDTVRHHRTVSGLQGPETIHPSIHIANDDEPVRILGVWVGPCISQHDVWDPVLTKVTRFLDRWGKCHPSLQGKRHIIQMGPGGITQYLAKVQGMPREVENRLVKIISSFIWGKDKRPPVSLDTLCLPICEGGMNILDIRARNEAIELTWLRDYLNMTPTRPIWAFAMDVLISINVSPSYGRIRPASQINSFLQSWRPSVSHQSRLPVYVKRILSVALRHHVNFEAVRLPRRLKEALPLWYHLGAFRRMRLIENTPLGDCLRSTHGVRIVADIVPLVQANAIHVTMPPSQRDRCSCESCLSSRGSGCIHPAKCYDLASRLSALIRPKWNLDVEPPPDGLSLTQSRVASQQSALTQGGAVPFNPSLMERGSISDIFRVFTDPAIRDFPPAFRPTRGLPVLAETTVVCIASLARSPVALASDPSGTRSLAGIFFGHGDPRNRRITPPCQGRLNDDLSCECLSMLYAVRCVPRDAPLIFVLINSCSITALTTSVQGWEDSGWIDVPSAPIL